MKIAKIITPIAALTLSALSVASCAGNNQPRVYAKSKTELVSQPQINDSFEQQSKQTRKETEEGTPWWQTVLGILGGVTVLGLFSKMLGPDIEKMSKEDKEAYLQMNDDYYGLNQ